MSTAPAMPMLVCRVVCGDSATRGVDGHGRAWYEPGVKAKLKRLIDRHSNIAALLVIGAFAFLPAAAAWVLYQLTSFAR